MRETNAFGPQKQWEFSNESSLDGQAHWGINQVYDGSGFVLQVPSTYTNAVKFFAYLKENNWIDRQSRAIFIDFTLYNANLNLFTIMRFLVEIHASGGLISTHALYPVRLLSYVRDEDRVAFAFQIVFCLFIVAFFVDEVKKVRPTFF